jgi:hypothetical protein
MGGKYVLPPAFQYIPSMLASYDWRVRHAGLMAIAAIGEGTSKVSSGLPAEWVSLMELSSLTFCVGTGHAE